MFAILGGQWLDAGAIRDLLLLKFDFVSLNVMDGVRYSEGIIDALPKKMVNEDIGSDFRYKLAKHECLLECLLDGQCLRGNHVTNEAIR